MKEFDWLQYYKLADLYNNADKVLVKIDSIRKERVNEKNNFEEITEVMICQHCRDKHYASFHLTKDYIPNNKEIKAKPFIFGAVSYRIESLRVHCKQSNTEHALAIDRSKNISKEKNSKLSDAQRITTSLVESEKKHLNILFFNIYGILKKGKPFSDYEFQAEVRQS